MEEQHPAPTYSAAFPAPPPFHQHFTPSNLARLEELLPQNPSSPTTEPRDLTSLPPELLYLLPPPPPPSGHWRSFGVEYSLNATTPPPQPQLYPPHSSLAPRTPLLNLTRSILLNFLELIHILTVNPAHYAQKWEDLRDLGLNAHALVNEYRPRQARETLILMMEEGVERGREEVRGVREGCERGRNVLKGCLDKDVGLVGREGKGMEERRVWQVLNQLD